MAVYTFELTRGSEHEFSNVDEYPEAASQSFKKYDPVVLNTSGKVKLAVDTGNMFGLALLDATGTTDTSIPVLKLTPEMEFSVSQSAAGATQVTVQTQVGLQCSYIKSTVTGETDKTVIDTDDTTNKNFEIVLLDTRDAVGASDGRVIVRPVPGAIAAR